MQGRASTTSSGRTEAAGSLKGGAWPLSMALVLFLLVRFMCEIQSPVPSEHLKRTAPWRLPVFVKTSASISGDQRTAQGRRRGRSLAFCGVHRTFRIVLSPLPGMIELVLYRVVLVAVASSFCRTLSCLCMQVVNLAIFLKKSMVRSRRKRYALIGV